MTDTPKRTPLYNLHVELGGKMVDFAGWEMPRSIPDGDHGRAQALPRESRAF